MIEIEQFETAEASIELLSDLRALLNTAFGALFSEDDWNHGMGGRHFAVLEEGSLVAYCAVVPRTIYVDEKPFSCGYLENVASAPDKRIKDLRQWRFVKPTHLSLLTLKLGAFLLPNMISIAS